MYQLTPITDLPITFSLEHITTLGSYYISAWERDVLWAKAEIDDMHDSELAEIIVTALMRCPEAMDTIAGHLPSETTTEIMTRLALINGAPLDDISRLSISLASVINTRILSEVIKYVDRNVEDMRTEYKHRRKHG